MSLPCTFGNSIQLSFYRLLIILLNTKIVVLFPNGKINLGLNIVRKRTDGFHDIETVFYPVAIHDALEVIDANQQPQDVDLSASGEELDCDVSNNLCVQAYQLLKKHFPHMPGIKMHLHKTMPVGAGLGGGSADGAFTLKLLNEKFGLGLSDEKLRALALELGSDCPFFLINKPCFATGRGEILHPIQLDLSRYKLLLVNPRIKINTAEAFSLANPVVPSKSIEKIINEPIDTWKNELRNDFEKPVFEKYPQIKTIKQQLYDLGAVYVSMTGSGSTVFGIFENNFAIRYSFPANYFVRELVGKVQQFP